MPCAPCAKKKKVQTARARPSSAQVSYQQSVLDRFMASRKDLGKK